MTDKNRETEFRELKKQVREMIQLDYIIPKDIPDIELYMDQVTSFMDTHLSHNMRDQEDRTLTRTMINNYTKNRILPPPKNKKYSKEHVILLIYIYYLKNVMSINDVQAVLYPMIDRFFDKPEDSKEKHSMDTIYDSIYNLEKAQYFNTEASITRSEEITEKLFPKEEDEYLHNMAFIYLLGYDIYSKKRLIEKIIDEMNEKELGGADPAKLLEQRESERIVKEKAEEDRKTQQRRKLEKAEAERRSHQRKVRAKSANKKTERKINDKRK